jgi:hypothetical protein
MQRARQVALELQGGRIYFDIAYLVERGTGVWVRLAGNFDFVGVTLDFPRMKVESERSTRS